MSLEANAAGAVPASSSTSLMPDVSPVAAPATNGHDTNASAAPPAAAKPSIDDDLMAVWNKLNPPREGGKFKAYKNGSESESAEPPATDPAVTESTADQPSDAGTKDDQASPTEAKDKTPPVTKLDVEAPLSWSAEMKAKIASLPPEFRDVAEYAARRDKETHEVITRAGQELKAVEPVRNVIEQFGETFQRNNLHPADGIARMLAMEQWLGNDPRSAISEIAKAYRVDLREIAGQPPAAPANADPNAPPPVQSDPMVAAMQDQLRATQAELRKVTSYLTEQQKAEHASRQAEVRDQQNALARQIADFASETKDGKPIRPHFEKVRKAMAALMEASDYQISLDQAYEDAVYANKDLRTQVDAERRAADEKKRADENAKKVADAKKAAGVNVRSTVGAANTPKTMDDTLREVARRHFS
jgi:hypothetical protein